MSSLDRKKVLLVQPLGYGIAMAGRDIARAAGILPPLGIASVSSFLARRGLSSRIIDYSAFPDSDGRVAEYLRDERPATVGLSCTTSTFLDGVRIAKLAKSVLPGVCVMFGGPHVSALKERILSEFPEIDLVVAGEGEETLSEVMESGGDDLGSIKGLVYREASGEVCFNGFREDGLEMDSLPYPAYEKLDGYPERYMLPIFSYPSPPGTSALSSRGCPYSCDYCDRSVFGQGYRFNSPEYLYSHMAYLKERFGIRHVTFYDDQFTAHRRRVDTFLDLLSDKPLGMTYNCIVRADHVDYDLLVKLKKTGCWMVSLGIETGDQDLLTMHNRKVNLDRLSDKIRLMKKAGLRVKGLLMIGLPGETEETVRKTKALVFSLPVDEINLAKFTPFPGSPLYQNIRDLGEFDEDWERMDCMHFVFVPKGMTKERLQILFKDFYKSHFKRPKVLWDYCTMTWRSPHSWSRFAKNLPAFIRYARSDQRIGHE